MFRNGNIIFQKWGFAETLHQVAVRWQRSRRNRGPRRRSPRIEHRRRPSSCIGGCFREIPSCGGSLDRWVPPRRLRTRHLGLWRVCGGFYARKRLWIWKAQIIYPFKRPKQRFKSHEILQKFTLEFFYHSSGKEKPDTVKRNELLQKVERLQEASIIYPARTLISVDNVLRRRMQY